ncbi:DUF1304 family protein [Oerskovia sp. NPDC060338]|uniref:DUF1304 family protein n=1 Tax=Oerskovia sp. NPDC060338 TaxID=3347100 RepID=UPI0036467D7E
MSNLAVVLAVAAGALHIGVGLVEAFLFHHRWAQQFLLHKDFSPREVDLWAFSVGFYNMFLGVGPILGVLLVSAGSADAGRALVLYTTAFMTLTGVTLFVADRRLWPGAVGDTALGLAAFLVTLTST